MNDIKCLVWNIEWASPTSQRGKIISSIIEEQDPDIICLTEGFENNLPTNGNVISSDPDYGYENTKEKRKVLLWSKYTWSDIDKKGTEFIPSGRFVTGKTHGIRFVGVCIPWKDAHVRTGKRNRGPWEDHLKYLDELESIINNYLNSKEKVVMLGDYNQTVPRKRQPEKIYEKLQSLIQPNFNLISSRQTDNEGKLLIDHVAVSQGQKGKIVKTVSRTSNDGVRLSDHPGIIAKLF